MKKILTLTVLVILAVAVHAQQASFDLGKARTVTQLIKSGWDLSNFKPIGDAITLTLTPDQNGTFNAFTTPYINLMANDEIMFNYRFNGTDENVKATLYIEDFAGNFTRITQLTASANTTSQKVIMPEGGKQRIVIRIEKNNTSSYQLAITSVSFSNYNEVQYTKISSKNMSIKKMQDTPDVLMGYSASANSYDYSTATSASINK